MHSFRYFSDQVNSLQSSFTFGFHPDFSLIIVMGKVTGPPLTELDQKWILKQHIFFHATAPLSASHRVNVSPKSAKEFKILDDSTVAWADLTGSGSETCAHLLQNGRLTVLFVAFTGPPKIVRLHGTGKIVLRSELAQPQHSHIAEQFKEQLAVEYDGNIGVRAVVVLNVERVSQSCGFSIPYFDYKSERTTLNDVTVKKGLDGIKEYRVLKNSYSIDGLPSIAQLEMAHTNMVPIELDCTDGYIYVTKYGNDLWKQLKVQLTLSTYVYDWSISRRDLVAAMLGAGVGALALHLLKKAK